MRVDDVDGPVVNAATRTPFEARRRVCVATRDDRLEHSAELVRHQDQVHLEPNVTEDLALSALGFRLAALAGAR